MTPEEFVCKWINDKTNEGRGAVIFSLDEHGELGVWIGEIEEGKQSLGWGSNVVEAVMHAASRDAVEQPLAPDVANCHELHHKWMKLYNFCPECGADVRHAGKA
jgi:hypothetical protein